jgi:hypothetical protein
VCGCRGGSKGLLPRNLPDQRSASVDLRRRPGRFEAWIAAVAIRNPPLKAADKIPAIVNASKVMVVPPFGVSGTAPRDASVTKIPAPMTPQPLAFAANGGGVRADRLP